VTGIGGEPSSFTALPSDAVERRWSGADKSTRPGIGEGQLEIPRDLLDLSDVDGKAAWIVDHDLVDHPLPPLIPT
jgi:hypothetical protein